MKYIQDAFTISDQFPHAQSFNPASDLPGKTGLGERPFNYIRNSVKIVTDAYDGSMTFYVADDDRPADPGLGGRLPDAVPTDLARCPADLVPHLRVPEELFDVQTRMYGTYHVTDPGDVLLAERPVDGAGRRDSKQSLPNEAYYVMMRMPGAAKAEFLLLQPMIPSNRPNMIAWVAVQNDPGVRGKTTRLPVPERELDLRAGPGRGPDRRRPDHQRPGHALGPVGQQRHPGQPDRRPRRRVVDLPPAGLPPVGEREVPGLPEDHRRLAAGTSSGARPSRRRSTCSCAKEAGGGPGPGRPAPIARRRRRRPGPSATPGPGARRSRRATSRRSSPTRTSISSSPRQALRNGDFARTAPRSSS